MDALDLLSFDEWRLVFRKLNPEDLLTCRLVCTPFLKLLDEHEFQRKWKFHIALPQLLPYLKMTTQSKPFVSWNNLKSIRLTDRSWRNSIDQACEMYEPERNFFSISLGDKPLATCLKSSEEIDEFHEMFDEVDINPFPSRTVFIGFPERAQGRALRQLEATYMEKVGNFMEHFGINLVKLELCLLIQNGVDTLALCKLLKRITDQVPNLKTFFVRSNVKGSVNNAQEVARYMEENPLGVMPKLQALRTGLWGGMVEEYLLNNYAAQLTHYERTSVMNQLQVAQIQQFTNLEKLWLELDRLYFRYPVLLQNLQCPLKFLKVLVPAITSFNQQMECNIDQVIRSVNHLPLEYLEVEIHLCREISDAPGPLAVLNVDEYTNESIRTLRILIVPHHGNDSFSFNFLEALRNLETLELEFFAVGRRDGVPTQYPANYPQGIMLNEYLVNGEGRADMPYRSNIWERVPSLKTLMLKWNQGEWRRERVGHVQATYTRKDYERVRREENVQNAVEA